MVVPPVARAGTTIFVTTVNQEINGDAFCSLQEAIYAANRDANTAPDPSNPSSSISTACPAGSGHDTIELPHVSVFSFADPIDDANNFIGPTVTPIITSDITIEGRGARLQRVDGGRDTRAFAVAANGFLDLREVHVKGFSIHGGNGGLGGGGGGMGAGGAIFVEGGSLLVQWSTFEGNVVHGGDGGDVDPQLNDAGGGGGGLSGDGGNAFLSGGGGGGSRGDGGPGSSVGDTDYGGGGGGRVTSATNDTPGQPCGAAGGESGFGIGGDGDSASPFCAGGGGGGGSATSDLFPGDGGSGSFGGGGGGAGNGGVVESGNGGDGGFGAGGGGAPNNQGGHGGFGGGGGQGNEFFQGSGHGQGGTFAGDGHDFAGGGGAGLGGAIFGDRAEIDIRNSTFAFNAANRGHAAGFANDGRGAGGAVFAVDSAVSIESSTFSGNETREFNDTPSGPQGIGGGAIVVHSEDAAASLRLHNTILANNGPFECYTRGGVSTSGSSNNIVTHDVTNSQGNAKCPGTLSTVDPGLGPLQQNAPGLTLTMAIGPTSSAINNAGGPSPADDQRGILRPQGAASDIGAYEYVAPAAVPPVTSIALTPSTPNGLNSWYTTAVGVAVTATDFDDAVAQTRCVLDPIAVIGSFADLPDATCALTTVSANGQHAIFAASIDAGGNVESPVVEASLKIDATAPTLAPSLNVTSVAIGQTGVVASPNATDGTSGVASSSCDAVETSTPGTHMVSCSATDNAGNMASATLAYVVEYRMLGFFSPVLGSKWRAGQTVPIKVALGDVAGTRIGDEEAAALARTCRVTFVATGVQPVSAKCLKYDASSDQFIFNWKLRKSPLGMATISVDVAYPSSSTRTTLSIQIEIVR